MRTKPPKYKTVTMNNVGGINMPTQPWPQVFLVSGIHLSMDAWEVRPLTLTALARGVGRNLITMNYWRFMITLRVLGLLATPEGCRLSWSHWSWTPWRYQMWWRLRIVRWSKSGFNFCRQKLAARFP